MENKTFILEESQIKTLHNPRVLALDLDLTLHNVVKHYDDSLNETIMHFGYPPLTSKEFEYVGNNFTSTKGTLALFLPEDKVDQALEYYFNHFLSREIPTTSVLPGAKELLYLIRKRFNIPIIGITNSEEFIAKKILTDLGVLEKFDYMIGVKDGFAPKPDSKMLLTALNHISVAPGPHVWLMGDRASDTECAKQVNCTSIRFYHKIKPQDPKADLFINSHYHLFNIISEKVK